MTEPSRQIGAYRIERELGRGGMGVVYLATDARLDRQVAIKVLPDAVAADPQRLARFEREAKLLAALKHPNIGGIHGLEEADGQRFLVLEYLEGETLARRLDAGPLRVAEAIHVCRQIAAALEAAHESGIIHRDLKPGNVMITDDDEVKVLDFGLAKSDGSSAESNSDLSASPTVAVGATTAGVILGTAAYMSPEQARGRGVDRRTDIWSFGCVLYECLTGKQLFGGDTVSDSIARILEREPDWNALPQETPDRVRELLRRCLEKKARERLRDIGDARIELEELESGKTSSHSGISTRVQIGAHRNSARLAWGVAGIAVIAAVIAGAAAIMKPAATASVPMRLEVSVPDDLSLFPQSDFVAISPDGTKIVFTATDSAGVTQLYVRDLATAELKPLPGTRDGFQPFWSPDSRHIGFFSNAKLRTMPIEGSAPEVIADVTSSRGGSWGDGAILFARAQGPIYRVSPEGGSIEEATQVDTASGQTAHRFPMFLPDGRHFTYAVLPASTGMVRIQLSDLDGARPKDIMSAGGSPVYAPSGHLVWQRGARLVAQAFDVGSATLKGKPFTIGPAPARADNTGAPPVSISRAGVIVGIPPNSPRSHLEWMDLQGRTIERLKLEDRDYTALAISPDGRYVAACIAENDFQSDLWLIDLERMTPTRLTFGPGSVFTPFWAPDGERILYTSDQKGPTELYVKSIHDPNSESVLVKTGAMFVNAMGWSPDGRHVLFSLPGSGTGMDLWTARVDVENPEPTKYLTSPYNEYGGAISPDGRWCAYASDESGRIDLYVTSFPEPGPKYRISTDGGGQPVWQYDGRALYFLGSDGWVMRTPVETSARFQAGAPVRAFRSRDNVVAVAPSPIRPRTLVAVNDARQDQHTLIVLTGWRGLEAVP